MKKLRQRYRKGLHGRWRGYSEAHDAGFGSLTNISIG